MIYKGFIARKKENIPIIIKIKLSEIKRAFNTKMSSKRKLFKINSNIRGKILPIIANIHATIKYK